MISTIYKYHRGQEGGQEQQPYITLTISFTTNLDTDNIGVGKQSVPAIPGGIRACRPAGWPSSSPLTRSSQLHFSDISVFTGKALPRFIGVNIPQWHLDGPSAHSVCFWGTNLEHLSG